MTSTGGPGSGGADGGGITVSNANEVPLERLAPEAQLGAAEFTRRRGTGFLLFTGVLRRSTSRGTVSEGDDTGETRLVVYTLLKMPGSAFPFVTIGRVGGNDLIVRDASVSKFHAYATHTDDGWTVRDGGSRNGTFVNELPVAVRNAGKATALHPQATLRLGSVRLVFLDVAALLALLDASTRV